MRIAFLVWESLRSIRVGGLATVATNLAEELAKRGHEIHIFTRADKGQTDYAYINGVHYHRVVFDPGPNILAFAHNMSKAMVTSLHEIEKYRGKFDIVHGHDWHVVDALHDLKQEGYFSVLTYHSTEYGRNGGAFGDWWEFREISGKEWYGGFISDRVTTVSTSMMNELNWLYKIPIEKIDVIPNAIDPRKHRVHVDPGMVKEKYGIHPLAPVVLFMGRIEYQKGPDFLVEAIPRVLSNRWDVKFIFVGGGGMRSYLEHRVNEIGVGHATRFLGKVPHWQYLESLNSGDIVCIPSRNEPFGIVLLEAWAAGKPVIATDMGGLGDNIENFVDGIKVYPNYESIAWGINYFIDNPDAMKQVIEGGRDKVKQFSWDNTLSKLLNTYRSILNR
jgi:glycogen(starch) synthase